MRVLVFSTDDHLYPAGGAEQAFGNIAERLPHIQFDLICAKLRSGVKGYEKVKNVNIYRMGFGIPKVDGIILALFGHYCTKKLMQKHSYDLIWSVMASYGAFSAVRVKKKTGLPFLLTLQEGDALEYIYSKVKFVRSSFNRIFQMADGVQAISRFLLQWAKDMGFKGEHGTVIPNGVALDAFLKEYPKDEISAKRASFGFRDDSIVLMTSSRLEKKNGIEDVITALKELPERYCFVVCGSGSLDTEIKSQVKELGLNTRVKFLGFVEPSELPLIMQASDIFIRPSLSEGLGTAFLEAMAAQLIVIGTPVGGIPDFLDDGRTGFMVAPENPRSIVEVIKKLEQVSDGEREKILERALGMIKETYDWDRINKSMEALFNEVIQHGSDHT